MKYKRLSKILLVFLILVIFANIVYANEDISVNENLTISEDSDLNLPEEIDDTTISTEENKDDQYCDDTLGISQEDVLTSRSVSISARCLNDTVYPNDVYRLEVKITNTGTEVMPVNSINATIYNNKYTNTILVNYEGEGWNNTSDNPKDPNFVYQKALNVGESTLLYMDLYTENSGNRSFQIRTYYKWSGNSITYRDTIFTVEIKRFTIEVDKKMVTDTPIFKGDYVTFNMTVRNVDYDEHGKTWHNVTLRDRFSTDYLQYVSSSFYDSNGNQLDIPCKSVYDGILFEIDELGETIYILSTFKTVKVGNTANTFSLETVNRKGYSNLPSSRVELTIYPHLTVEKSAKEENLYSGEVAEYEVVVENIWNESISDFYITENIPTGLTFLSYEGDGWTKIKDYVFTHEGAIAPGSKAVLNLKFKVNSNLPLSSDPENPTVIENEVILTFGNNFNSFASAPIYVTMPPATINKKSLNQIVELGDNVAFNITLANPNDDDNAVYHDVMITDIVPGGLEFISCIGIDSNGDEIEIPYIIKEGNVIFLIAEYSHNLTITATFKTTGTGNITNKVVYGLVDEDDSQNGESSQDWVFVNAHMIVEKTCLNETVFSGDTITYKINITNNENFDLTNIILNEEFPQDLTYVGFEGDGWSRDEDNSFKYSGSIAPKDSTCLYLSFNVSSDFTGYMKNNVTVSSDETKNVSSSAEIYVDAPRIALTKKYLDTNRKILGDTISYSITVTCINNPCYYNIDVTDIPGRGLEFLEAYYLDNDGNRMEASFTRNGSSIIFHIDKINQSMSIIATFNTTQPGIIKNIAMYKDIYRDCDIRVDTLSIDFMKYTEDFIWITSRNINVQGDNVLYYVSLKNKGDSDITNLTITENSPEGLTLIRFYGDNWEEIGDNTFRLNQTLYSGNTTFLELYYQIDGNVSGNLTNEVTASADDMENLTTSFTIEVSKQDIALDKIALNESVWVGDNVTFDIIVRNNSTGKVVNPDYWFPGLIGSANPDSQDVLGYPEIVEGNGDAYYLYHDVQITDVIPDGLEFLDCYAVDEYGEETPLTYRIEGNKVIFTLGTLNRIATIKATFKAVKPGNHTNIVSKDDVTAEDDVFVYFADMEVQKISNNKTVYAGEEVSFTIIVRNTGNTNLSEVFVIDEDFSDGLLYEGYVSNDEAGWKKDHNTYYYNGVLKPNETASFDIFFKTLKEGNFTNSVIAGSNATENKTAENVTEAIEHNPLSSSTPENDTSDDSDVVDDVQKQDPIAKKVSKNIAKTALPTGNPVFALLLVLMLLGSDIVRKIKK